MTKTEAKGEFGVMLDTIKKLVASKDITPKAEKALSDKVKEVILFLDKK